MSSVIAKNATVPAVNSDRPADVSHGTIDGAISAAPYAAERKVAIVIPTCTAASQRFGWATRSSSRRPRLPRSARRWA
ncbi:unannotated protein [freshwater metagenome]|uniref:Unannotated protein n=1 Tax=freshwater metagenome TaxID=449393 RepID=A0A6J7IXE7_9ZZZZ